MVKFYSSDMWKGGTGMQSKKMFSFSFFKEDEQLLSTVDAPISALPNSAQAPISAPFLGYQLFLCSKSPQ